MIFLNAWIRSWRVRLTVSACGPGLYEAHRHAGSADGASTQFLIEISWLRCQVVHLTIYLCRSLARCRCRSFLQDVTFRSHHFSIVCHVIGPVHTYRKAAWTHKHSSISSRYLRGEEEMAMPKPMQCILRSSITKRFPEPKVGAFLNEWANRGEA